MGWSTQLSRFWTVVSGTGARRRRPTAIASRCISAEVLEERQMLSAVMDSGQEMAAISVQDSTVPEEGQSEGKTRLGRKAAQSYPDISGQWSITTFVDENFEVNGTLNLTQKGRKFKGTLQNELQPAETFKGKFDKQRAETGTIRGKTKNLALDSKAIFFIADVIASIEDARIDGEFRTKSGSAPFIALRAL